MFKRLFLALFATILASTATLAQSVGMPTVEGYWSTGDCGTGPSPCFRQYGGCNLSAPITVAAAATTEIVALTASRSIRVCSFVISGDTLATVATFVYGTGTNCVTSPSSLTGAMRLQDEGNISASWSTGYLFSTAAGNALCLTAATGAVTGFVTYAKQ